MTSVVTFLQVSSDRVIVDLQEQRLVQEISNLEKDTGFKLRVLAQNYPDTPGVNFFSPSLLNCFCMH